MRELARRHEPEPMRWAADHNHVPLLRYLSPYERDGEGPDDEDSEIHSALKLALKNKHWCFAKELVTLDTTLKELNLQYIPIGDEGATALGRALEKNSTLTELNLNGNSYGDEGATALRTAWADRSYGLYLNIYETDDDDDNDSDDDDDNDSDDY